MRPGDEFIRLFNELSSVLQVMTGKSDNVIFSQLLEVACKISPTIHRSKSFLKAMGDLRNAIVHDRNYPEVVIADPRPEVIAQFQRILETIKSPTKVIPKFQRKILVFLEQDALGVVLGHMQENDYSQVVVHIDKEYRILSSEGIVRWLSSARQDGLADIEGASVKDVYGHEDPKAHRHMARNETTDAAILAFERAITDGIPRLQAIVITNSGKPTEQPLGIITPWDLLEIAGKNDLA
jgi:predicted transcriptional regulator